MNKIKRDIDSLNEGSLVLEAKVKQACMERLTLKDDTVALIISRICKSI